MKLVVMAFAAVALTACSSRALPSPDREGRHADEVVFVCEHGAAKSVVAMAYFNQLAAARGLPMRAVARGADPQAQLSTSVVAGLQADGLSSDLEPPRQLGAADLRSAARIVAFDCGQPSMAALRGMDACWDDVPATAQDYPRARDIIRSRVSALVDELAAQANQ